MWWHDICSGDICSADNCSADNCSGDRCSEDTTFAPPAIAPLTITPPIIAPATFAPVSIAPPTIIASLKYAPNMPKVWHLLRLKYAPKIIHAPQQYLFHRHLLCRRLNRQFNSQDCVWFLMWNYERHLKRKSFINNFAQLFCFLIEWMLWSRWNWSTIDSVFGSFKYCIGFGIRKCCE